MLWFPRFWPWPWLAIPPGLTQCSISAPRTPNWELRIYIFSRDRRVLSKIVQPLKSLKFSQNSDFWNLIFFTKFTFLKSQFSQNSHVRNLIFHKIHKIHISEIPIFTKFTLQKIPIFARKFNLNVVKKLSFFLARKMWIMWKIRTFPRIPIFARKFNVNFVNNQAFKSCECSEKIKLFYCERCELCEKSAHSQKSLFLRENSMWKKIKLSYCEKCELCEKSGFENVNLIEKSSF